MTPEDAEVARMVRRELGRRPMDTSQMDIQVKAGKITMAGRVAHLGEDKGANLRAEIEIVTKILTRDRLVKGVYDQLHYVVDRSGDGKDEHNARGRMRTDR